MIEILAVLSVAAAGGMRVGLPLLVIGVIQSSELWAGVPLLSALHPQVLIGILVSWSLCELVLAKDLVGQRIQQVVQLVLSPITGAILSSAVAIHFEMATLSTAIAALVGAFVALVIQLVQTGWFFRLRGIPLWINFAEDFLCICLVLFAFDAPRQGGIIALLLLWLALRSSLAWRQWYQAQADETQGYTPGYTHGTSVQKSRSPQSSPRRFPPRHYKAHNYPSPRHRGVHPPRRVLRVKGIQGTRPLRRIPTRLITPIPLRQSSRPLGPRPRRGGLPPLPPPNAPKPRSPRPPNPRQDSRALRNPRFGKLDPD